MSEAIKSNKNQSTGWAPYASIALSTISGFSIGRFMGGAAGFTTGLADEYFISQKASEKHYLSTTMFYSTMVFQPWAITLATFFPDYTPAIQGISYSLSIVASHFTNDFLDFHNKLDVPLDTFLTINKIFDEKEIFSSKEANIIYNKFLESPMDAFVAVQEGVVEIYNNPFLSNFIASTSLSLAQVGLDNLTLYYLGSYGSNLFISTLLATHNNAFADPKFLIDAGKIVTIFALKLFSDMQINTIQNRLSEESSKIIIGKGADILLDKGNSRKILSTNKEEGQLIIKELIGDLSNLLNGTNKLNTVIRRSTELVIALNNLVKFSPDILLPYTIISLMLQQNYLNNLIPKSKSIAEGISFTSMKVSSLMEDIIEKSEQISLRDGEEFMKYKFNIQWSKFKNLHLNSTAISKSKSYINYAISIHDKFIDVVYFGFKHYTKSLDISKIPLIDFAMSDVCAFLSSNINSQTDNIEIVQSKKRIDKLLGFINAPNHHADRIDNEDGNIYFKDYSIFLGKQKLVQIDNLIFEKGKHYAITGKSGCGKSSTLIDLKEGVVGILNSNGEIHLPFNSQIMYLDQQLYIPTESTLLEIIYFPGIIDKLTADEVLNLKALVIYLFQELEIDSFVNAPESIEGLISNLDTQKFKLSGGQMQKIAIIQAILNKSDIIIMDETFARLDNNSVIKIQQAIVKYLGNATILVVDHKAHSHNYNNFYDAEVHFKNAAIIVSKIALTTSMSTADKKIGINEESTGEVMNFMQSIVEEKELDIGKLKLLSEKLSKLFDHIETHKNFTLEELLGECAIAQE